MNTTNDKAVTTHDINNSRHVLRLLQSQVKTGRIDAEYMLKQLNKVSNLLERVDNTQKSTASTDRFEVLYNISRMLGTSLDQQTVLDQVMDAVIQLTGAERGFLVLRDDDGDLMVKAARNLDQQTLDSNEFDYSRSIVDYVLETQKPVQTTNALEDPRFSSRDSVVNQALRSIMATPLLARGNIIGVAYVENRIISGLFTDEALATLKALTAQAAVAIDNAMLYGETDAELKRRVDELRELRGIDMKLNEKLDPDEAILYTLEKICNRLKASSGHLGLLTASDDDTPHFTAVHHYDEGTATMHSKIHLEKVYPQIETVLETKEAVTFDSGQYGLVTVLITPIIRDGEVAGVIVLKREDGGGFTLEQREFIGRIVSRAAITIENARLYSAVQAADKAKSEFVGIVAHDLKAPMTSIKGYADLMMMERNSFSERHSKFLGNITATVRRMEVLVSDLSDISRIESGQFFMTEMRVAVNTIVEAVHDTTMPEMTARNHTYEAVIADNLPEMWVDYYRLVQVLTNIVSNAYKYTPDGGTITLKVDIDPADEKRIRFEVCDTGIGLSEEAIEQLGTKFWRAEDDYTRSQSGTGLGYAITDVLVQQMGSHITIESIIGEGSCFSFSIAIADNE